MESFCEVVFHETRLNDKMFIIYENILHCDLFQLEFKYLAEPLFNTCVINLVIFTLIIHVA